MLIIRKKAIAAHRAAWMMWKGDIPEGICVLHKCDNPKCINPEHLFLGTRIDNNIDKFKKGRQSRLKGVENGKEKLNEKDIFEIREITKNKKYNVSELSRKYNVSRFCINSIIHRKSWKHI